MDARRSILPLIAIAVAAFPTPPPLRAHDLWLAPSSFAPAVGEPIRLQLILANGDQIETVPRADAGIVRFVAAGPDGDKPVLGLDGLDPAGFLRPQAPGWYTIVYESTPSFTTLAPETFRSYLLEKGLDTAAATASSSSASVPGAPAATASPEPATSELFRRSIKARIRVAGPSDAVPLDPSESKPAGLPLELMLERATSNGQPTGDQEVVLRLLLDGAPLEGAQVDLRRLDDLGVQAKTTDAAGRVRMRLRPGSWVATSVHLDASRPAVAADWESVWASLTFELR